MAEDIRTVLSKYVPSAVLDQAVEEVSGTDIAPEWFRQEVAKLGGAAKERDELKARLESIESAPKRKEALRRVGIDYDQVPKYGQKALDEIPTDDLDDLEKVAKFVSEQGFEAKVTPDESSQGGSGAEQITDFLTNQGTGSPATETYEQAMARAKTPEEVDAVYQRFNKAPAQQ